MERKISFAENEFYHLYNRGVEKRTIFTSPRDYKRFLILLYIANDSSSTHLSNILNAKSKNEVLALPRKQALVAIGAFCLMPNHFHLLITPLVENGISKFMLKVQTGYSMYFNKKYERSGALFQGTFKGERVADDNYLQYLYAYIHLNPAKIKDSTWKKYGPKEFRTLKDFVMEYPYSSISEYLEKKHTITNPKPFPDYFGSSQDFKQLIEFWLSFNKD